MANIILFGPPGAGKRTQADNLANEFNLFKVSTGDLLREEIKKKSQLGNKIKSIIDRGGLVQDDIINDLIENILTNKGYFDRLIFDGYPRNLNQVKNLNILIKKYDQKISCVLSLKVDQEVIIKRILGRQVCSKCGLIFNTYFNPSTSTNHTCGSDFLKSREDDKEDIIVKRFKTYTRETLPILNHYKEQNLLYEIEGKGDISAVYEKIRKIMLSLAT